MILIRRNKEARDEGACGKEIEIKRHLWGSRTISNVWLQSRPDARIEAMLNCRGRNRIISIQSAADCCCTINCNWILDTSNRTFNKAHTKWLLLDFYLLAIPMSGFQLLIECCRIVFFAQKKREIEGRSQSGDSPSATIN